MVTASDTATGSSRSRDERGAGPHQSSPPRRVVVAMSGGVDSSVVAALMQAAGHEVIGITLQLYDHGAATGRKGSCCAGEDIHDARTVADRLGIAHYVLDYEKRFARAVIRGLLRWVGVSLQVVGFERIPAETCLVVANHASYLDGFIFTAVLPPRFAFVVKQELEGPWISRLLLRRVGTVFVERFEPGRGEAEAGKVLAALRAGQSAAITLKARGSLSVLGRLDAGGQNSTLAAASPGAAISATAPAMMSTLSPVHVIVPGMVPRSAQ